MNLRFKAEFGSGGAQPMQLRIGAIESVLHSWLIEWVQAPRKEHPALELALTGGIGAGLQPPACESGTPQAELR